MAHVDVTIEESSSTATMPPQNLTHIEFLKKLQEFTNNKAIDDTSFITLLIFYAILILFGVAGNGLVCAAVIRKPSMRTDRNVFIINLACSDLLLCIFTMPFSLVDIAFKHWQLGGAMCKLVAGLQATSIFVSAISITAIALDRYRVIVNPTQRQACHPLKTLVTISGIWIFALILASPLFVFRQVDTLDLESKSEVFKMFKLDVLHSIDYCIENWPLEHGRAYYSVFAMVFQYVIPILIVTVAYMGILRKLKHRMVRATKATQLDDKKRRDKQRIRKTNLLLFSVAIIFGLSWLPLNILNIVADMIVIPISDSKFRIFFAICHMIGMSSACSNPLLYGWLNDNFRKEFVDIFSTCNPSLRERRSLTTVVDTEAARDMVGERTHARLLSRGDIHENGLQSNNYNHIRHQSLVNNNHHPSSTSPNNNTKSTRSNSLITTTVVTTVTPNHLPQSNSMRKVVLEVQTVAS